MRQSPLCAALLVGGLCLSACGSENSAPVEAGLTPDQAVSRVLMMLDEPMVLGAEMIADPSDNPSALPWVRVHIDSDGGDGVNEVWLGGLVEGAVGALMASPPSEPGDVIGGEIVDTGPDGRTVHTTISFTAAHRKDFDSPSDSELRARVSTVARKFGLEVMSVSVLHPLDSALAVTFTVPNGPVTWDIDQLRTALEGSPLDVEGTYVELDSASNEPLLRTGGDERMKLGSLWFAAGQDDRFGAEHG